MNKIGSELSKGYMFPFVDQFYFCFSFKWKPDGNPTKMG